MRASALVRGGRVVEATRAGKREVDEPARGLEEGRRYSWVEDHLARHRLPFVLHEVTQQRRFPQRQRHPFLADAHFDLVRPGIALYDQDGRVTWSAP